MEGPEHQVKDLVGAIGARREEKKGLFARLKVGSALNLEDYAVGALAAGHPHDDRAARQVTLDELLDFDENIGGQGAVRRSRLGSDHLDPGHRDGLVGEVGIGDGNKRSGRRHRGSKQKGGD